MAILLTTLLVLLLAADPALAYIGPGAGLELVGYFIALLATVGVAFFSILLYPIYAVIRFFRGPKAPATPETPAAAPTIGTATEMPPSPAPAAVSAEQTGATPN
jgi:hypothetical protein